MKSIESAHEEGQQPHVFAVLGDIHGRWKLALGALICLERELDVRIEQLFCVGDLGWFLDEDDWAYLTGPKNTDTQNGRPRFARYGEFGAGQSPRSEATMSRGIDSEFLIRNILETDLLTLTPACWRIV
jgi:hypothetical protein